MTVGSKYKIAKIGCGIIVIKRKMFNQLLCENVTMGF